MYIFKNPKIGGEVVPHMDNSFLTTDPWSCTGIWIALDDATLENGCLWAVPGSHTSQDPNAFLRTRTNEETGIMETYMDLMDPFVPYNTEGAVPLEVEAGSIVLLHGSLVHYSSPNTSDKQRHAYSCHVLEKKTDYCIDNWIRRDDKNICNGIVFRDLEI